MVGDEASKLRSNLELSYPMENGKEPFYYLFIDSNNFFTFKNFTFRNC